MAIVNKKRLAFAGPADPATGFPRWFEDADGARLELALRADPMTPAIADLPFPPSPIQFPGNFPDESFYFIAEARLPVGGVGIVGRARVILALEAAFGGAGVPAPGMNVVFARIRVRIDDVIPGAMYTVTHPYGVTDPLEADDRGRVFHTEDLGIVEGDPTRVLQTGCIAPFLKWKTGAPAGYLGDGVSERAVTGSPFETNFVSIHGPRIGEGGGQPDPDHPGDPERVWTNLFTVQGRETKQLGASVERATYAVDGAQRRLRIHARSAPGQTLELAGTGLRILLAANGRDYSGLAGPATVPADLQLFNTSDVPPSHVPVTFTDEVLVESVVHDLAAKTLTIKARSSDPAATLALPQFGDLSLTSSPQTLTGIAATPAQLVVTSNQRGSGMQWVEITGTPSTNLPVAARAVALPPLVAGEPVTLDGTGSPGATSFAWSQTSGPNVALSGAATATARFTPASAGTYGFQLTVQGAGGPAIATVSVSVAAAPGPDTLVVERAEYRTARREYRLSGTVNNVPNEVIVKTSSGVEIGRGTPDVTGDWSVRRVLLEAEVANVPTTGSTLSVNSKSATVVAPVTIRN